MDGPCVSVSFQGTEQCVFATLPRAANTVAQTMTCSGTAAVEREALVLRVHSQSQVVFYRSLTH